MTADKTSALQGWIRTLWPIVISVVGLAMLFQQLDSRVSALEDARTDTDETIACLQSQQATMMTDIATLKAYMETLAENTTWMRNNWPWASTEHQ